MMDDPDNEYEEDVVKLGVKRKYESLRNFKDSSGEVGDKYVKWARYDRRKQRSFLKRQSVITEKEKSFFNMLNKSYMTEESDGSDGELILHKHSRRSEKVNKWMDELDRRHSSNVAGKSSTPCKVRMEGAPANSLPPKDAPEWAVDPNWSKEGVNSEAENDDHETEFIFEEDI